MLILAFEKKNNIVIIFICFSIGVRLPQILYVKCCNFSLFNFLKFVLLNDSLMINNNYYYINNLKYYLYMKSNNQQTILLSDSHEITIRIKDPILPENTYKIITESGNITYKIIGLDKNGAIDVRRKLNQFIVLREILKRKWAGCYLPPVPSKALIGGNDITFVEERRRQIEYFFLRLSSLKYIYYGDVVQMFLHTATTEVEQILEVTMRDPLDQILKLYLQVVKNIEKNESINDIRARINTFYQYIKVSQKELKKLKEEMKQVSTTKRQYEQLLNSCTTTLIPQYQNNIFKQYLAQPNQPLLFADNPQIIQKIQDLSRNTKHNSFDLLVDLIALELKELMSFKQAIEYIIVTQQIIKKIEDKKRDDQEQLNKLTANKTTLKSIFTKGSKNDQIKNIEKSLVDSELQVKNLKLLTEYNCLLTNYEIFNYKAFQQKYYYTLLKNSSEMEIKHMHVYGNLIKSILIANNNLGFN